MISTYQELGLIRTEPAQIVRMAGYAFNVSRLHGLYLLSPRNYGKQLLIRIKHSRGALLSEIDFWGEALASMVDDFSGFDCVSYPPSSHPGKYYLAQRLAEVVASIAGLPLHEHFINHNPRNTMCSMGEKLREVKNYSYTGDDCRSILMVDDAVSTRKTAVACITAAGARSLFWLFLYASVMDRQAAAARKVKGVKCAA